MASPHLSSARIGRIYLLHRQQKDVERGEEGGLPVVIAERGGAVVGAK
jgi:hypothetical protein